MTQASLMPMLRPMPMPTLRLMLMSVLLLLLLPIAPLGAQEPRAQELTGRVVDASGQPVAGANVVWLGTSVGAAGDAQGRFRLALPSALPARLVTSCIGYESDTTLVVTPAQAGVPIEIRLREGVLTDEVEVSARQLGTLKLRNSVLNEDQINQGELLRAACCNLGESFTTNPSVDVSYADAATGARQIRLLGLSGTYVQLLTENIPALRGAAAPFALSYIAGPWMQSIQVSKGCSSVKNGYEAIAGQINIELLKPQAEQSVHANLFAGSMRQVEANADANIALTPRLSTGLLLHYENSRRNHDDNGDGFIDLPRIEQWAAMNRWAYVSDRYIFQAAAKFLHEDRTGGQTSHSMSSTDTSSSSSSPLYHIGIRTDRIEAFAKNAYIYNPRLGGNVALILAASHHHQHATYGLRAYQVRQTDLYASLMLETNLGPEGSSLSAGLSLVHDIYRQHYRLTHDADLSLTPLHEDETTPGAYVQYTLALGDQLTLMGGLRLDHSSLHGTFLTPRMHLRWSPSDAFTLRASAGRGYRTPHALAENHNLLASGRTLSMPDQTPQERAWNYGLSATTYLPLAGRTLTLSAEYYYTRFTRQLLVDTDTDPHATLLRTLQGGERSYSHTLQAEASYPLLTGLTLSAAYRLTNARATTGGIVQRRPLTPRYKGLLTASYQTPLGLWQVDVTLQLIGGGRMPTPYDTTSDTSSDLSTTLTPASPSDDSSTPFDPDYTINPWTDASDITTIATRSASTRTSSTTSTLSWRPTFPSYQQLSLQVTRWFRHFSIYVGAENLTAFRQHHPILNPSTPWSTSFDATLVWGPIHGATYYAGLRLRW